MKLIDANIGNDLSPFNAHLAFVKSNGEEELRFHLKQITPVEVPNLET